MLVNFCVDLHVRKGTLQHKVVNLQGTRGFCLQNQLICNAALTRLVDISLAVVDCCLHHPLIVEGGKFGRLIVELVHVLVGSVWLQLQICEEIFMEGYSFVLKV